MAREQVKRKPGAKGAGPALLGDGLLLDQNGAPVTNDPWSFLSVEDEIPAAGDIVISLPRYLAGRDALAARKSGRLGVLVAPADKVEDLAQDVRNFALIAVSFPAYRDGRGFTTARLLRDRYGYAGELRAVGDVLPDLVFFMLRCGFSALALKSPDPVRDFKIAAGTFSQAYQPASDARTPVYALRRQRRKGTS